MRLTLIGLIFIMASCSSMPDKVQNRSIAEVPECISIANKILNSKEAVVFSNVNRAMKKYGYTITNGSLYKDNNKIGEVETVSPRYLYEWQDYESHAEWIKNGKITKKEMDFILASEGQSSGRGYYISTDPFDSDSYGEFLTVFKIDKPMLVLHNSEYGEDQKILHELREIGIAGVRGHDHKTWYSIINEKYLSEAVVMDKTIAEHILKTQPEHLDKLTHHGFIEDALVKASTKTIKSIFAGEKVSKKELKVLLDDLVNEPQKILNITRDIYFYKKILPYLSPTDVQIMVSKNSPTLSFFSDLYKTIMNDDLMANSWAIFFDFTDTAILSSNTKEAKSAIAHMKKIAKNYANNWSEKDMLAISNEKDFLDSIKNKLKINPEIRDSELLLPSYSADNSAVEISGETYKYVSKKNSFLKITNITPLSNDAVEANIFHTGLNNLEELKELLTPEELLSINSLKDTPQARELMLTTLMKKFFDKSYFDKILNISEQPGNGPKDLMQLFSSLHPFADPALNRAATKIYYEWLIKNHFSYLADNRYYALTNAIALLPDHVNYVTPAWYNAQLKLSAAKSDQEMIEIAKKFLKNDVVMNTLFKTYVPYLRKTAD